MPEDRNQEKTQGGVIQRLVEDGSDIAGAAVSGALAFLALGPTGAATGAAGGAALAKALRHVGCEMYERFLGPREKARIGGVLAIAAADIKKRLDAGQSVRSDGFFDEKSSGRSDADEVAENVLLKSQREPEEKKIPYMGHLLSNIAFDPLVSAQMAHQIIKAAEQLTYRQLCILKLAVTKEAFRLRDADYRSEKSFSKELYQVLYECLDLYHRAFIHFGNEVALGLADAIPGKMAVQGLGADLYNLMELWRIPDDDLIVLAAQLK